MDESSNSEVIDAEIVSPATPQTTGIQLTLRFFPLAFLLLFCTPVVVINGAAHRLAWGSHWFPLQPGHYNVKVFFPYLFWPECGANSVVIELHHGTVRTVDFFMWPWVFAKGTMSVT